MSVLKEALAVLLKQEVQTLGEYLENGWRIIGGEKRKFYNDSTGELKSLLEGTLVLEDPFVPKGLKDGFYGLKGFKFNSLENSLEIGGARRKLIGISIEKLLQWSSILGQSYFSSVRSQYRSSEKRFRKTEFNETVFFSPKAEQITNSIPDIEKETLYYQVQDFEVLLCKHFPKIKISHLGSLSSSRTGFDFLKSKKYSLCTGDTYKFQNLHAWEILLSEIGPIEILFIFVCCIAFRKVGENPDYLIQQTGRMLTNDFLEELARLNVTKSKRICSSPSNSSSSSSSSSSSEHSLATTPSIIENLKNKREFEEDEFEKELEQQVEEEEEHALKTWKKNPKSSSKELVNESRLSRIYKIDIPYYSTFLYCDHFSKKGGLPCLSILRLLPPNPLGARTLLRFIIQSEHIFKDHDRQSLIALLGSYEMTKYTRVRCKLASFMLGEFQKLLLNVREISPMDFLGKMCPIEPIKDSDLQNVNKLPVLCFETSSTKVINFLRLYLIKVLPKNILGTLKNFKTFINKKIPIIVNLHVRETFKIKHAMNKIEVSNWVNRILEEKSYSFNQNSKNSQFFFSRSKKVPNETRSKIKKNLISLGKIYLAKNIYFLIVHLVIPILRRHFYVTEIEGSNKVRYFRHPVWIKIVRQADKWYLETILRVIQSKDPIKNNNNSSSIEQFSNLIDKNSEYCENIPKIRWVPKSKGLRPLLNLSKVGTGQILQQILEREHSCEEKKKVGFCDCNSVWIGGDLPTSWINYNYYNYLNNNNNNHHYFTPSRTLMSNIGIGINSLSSVPINQVNKRMRRPSSSRILDARRPSTNNMLLYPSKILRSFLIKQEGRNYLGSSLIRYGDIYKMIKCWWIGNSISKNQNENLSHRKIYIIKADLLNCFENINKSKIFELLDSICLPKVTSLLSLYSRTLSKTRIIPPFSNMSKDSFQDEFGRVNIITSKGRLNTVPIFEKDLQELDLDDDNSLTNLKDFYISNKDSSILGQKKVEIFTFLNSRRIINWKFVKEILKIHLNSSFMRLRTCSKSTRFTKTKQMKKLGKFGKKILSIFKQDFGIPQGSSVSYILCCLYYGLLDLNPEIQNLVGNSSFYSSFFPKQINFKRENSFLKKNDLETKLFRYRYPLYKENEINYYNINNKRRKIETSKYNIATSVLESSKENNINIQNKQQSHFESINRQENILLRWVDDFLFLTSNLESAKKFLKLLYIKKLWGSNVSKDKINSNFLWFDHNNEIITFEADDTSNFSSSWSSISKDHLNNLLEMNGKNAINKEEVINKVKIALKQYQKQLLWTGMKFSSDSMNLNCRISPWKNLEFICVMDTVTLTTKHEFPSNYSISCKFKPVMMLESFQKSNYMWSVLGIKLIRYFDFRIKNGLLYDCNINSINTVSLFVYLLQYNFLLNYIKTPIDLHKYCNCNVYWYFKVTFNIQKSQENTPRIH